MPSKLVFVAETLWDVREVQLRQQMPGEQSC